MAEEENERDYAQGEHARMLATAQEALIRRYAEIAEYIAERYWQGVQNGKAYSDYHFVEVPLPGKFGTHEVELSGALLEEKFKLHFVGFVNHPGLLNIFGRRKITVAPGRTLKLGFAVPGIKFRLF